MNYQKLLESSGKNKKLELVKYDYWQKRNEESKNELIEIEDEFISVMCLMPNGVGINLTCPITFTMEQMKANLWDEAECIYPLYGELKSKSNYIIKAIKSFSAVLEEINDESQRIVDIQPFFALFKLELRQQKDESTDLKQNISILIGKKLDDFKILRNSVEVNNFRSRIDKFSHQMSTKCASMTPKEKISFRNPPRLAKPDELLPNVNKFVIAVNLLPEENVSRITMEIPYNAQPEEVLEKIIQKIETNLNICHNHADDILLKVCGQEEYILGGFPIIQLAYIQECIQKNEMPVFSLTKVCDILREDDFCPQLSKKASSKKYVRSQSTKKSSWELDENFKIVIQAINNLKIEGNKTIELGVCVGLFHGGRALCENLNTTTVFIPGNERTAISAEWNQIMNFNIKICDIPRMTKLCFVVYYIDKNSSQFAYDDYKVPILWSNTTIYDFKNQLKVDGQTLYTWVYVDFSDTEEMLLPLGTVEQNPRIEESAWMTIFFPHPNHSHNQRMKFIYPSDIDIGKHAKVKQSQAIYSTNRISSAKDIFIKKTYEPFMHNDKIMKITKQEQLHIWETRYSCMNLLPNFLPYLLCCIDWNDRENITEVVDLLKQWPYKKMCVEQVLKLLDYNYADKSVRKFAVNYLNDIDDDVLQIYLLQLVQALKHELYLHCDLVTLLLQRAVQNQRIGQYLFWYLRSEINVPSVEIRFSLILEAYLRSSQEHIPVLMKQHNCLERLKFFNDHCKNLPKEKAKEKLARLLKTTSANNDLANVISPLDPKIRWKKVIKNKFKIMDSKKKPILFHYENFDPHGREIQIIYKEGDDLRQDMLILQMLRIMERLWMHNGYDFKLSIYNCINMENGNMGMIEPVSDSETVANILKNSGPFPKKEALFEWIKKHNNTEELLNTAIDNFTKSCAGYCVATYVLGIADRHPNNIMVKTNGQMFHIDFGHILGNFKEKFGIKRERVAFVLTNDFVHVINRGRKINNDKDEVNKEDFENFRNLCEQAFLILHNNGSLLLSLFSMMIQTGLPELKSLKDLDYMREKLALDYPENDAVELFKAKFDEALKSSWTSFNWFIHMLNRNN
ncbi:hypothetical protein PVAND_009036 [Polypedilum vanderplanki]|uniref:Phosphatidylinositol 3-kinase n=1 Tax=Polypedilum vanderplanki TaxID=319348 RepID=A0A9J6CBV0_POLVA|nr:hypothetical protein PVAND_009036 [Polypedilum vanderplanki]